MKVRAIISFRIKEGKFTRGTFLRFCRAQKMDFGLNKACGQSLCSIQNRDSEMDASRRHAYDPHGPSLLTLRSALLGAAALSFPFAWGVGRAWISSLPPAARLTFAKDIAPII